MTSMTTMTITLTETPTPTWTSTNTETPTYTYSFTPVFTSTKSVLENVTGTIYAPVIIPDKII